jgi:hypothetical protein
LQAAETGSGKTGVSSEGWSYTILGASFGINFNNLILFAATRYYDIVRDHLDRNFRQIANLS